MEKRFVSTFGALGVSVLFSEPKIPQCRRRAAAQTARRGFSALQRAENSSIGRARQRLPARVPFQCSSASRKFLNLSDAVQPELLQRFQCSSASRKFLNRCCDRCSEELINVSVLFSEPKIPQSQQTSPPRSSRCVSVLFSEPKIPQF